VGAGRYILARFALAVPTLPPETRAVQARLLESRQRFVPITSPAIIEEIAKALARVDLLRAKAIREVDAERLIAVLRRARRVEKDLRNLEEYEGVKIRFPEEFLRELGEAQ
jgi:hypothetical protein